MSNKSKSKLQQNDEEKTKKKSAAEGDRKHRESKLRAIFDKVGLTNAKFKSTDLVADTNSSKKLLTKSKSTSSEGSGVSIKKSKTKKSTIPTVTSSSATKKSTPSLPSLGKASDEKSSTGDEASKMKDGSKTSKTTGAGAARKTPIRFPIMKEVKVIRGATEFFNLEDYKTPNQNSALKSRTETQNTEKGASKTSYCNVNVSTEGQDTAGDDFCCQNNKRKSSKKARPSPSVKYTYGKMGPQKETRCTKWTICGFCGVVVLGVVLILIFLYFMGVVKSSTLDIYSTTTTSNLLHNISTTSGFYPAIPHVSTSTDSDTIYEEETTEEGSITEETPEPDDSQAIGTWPPENRTISDNDDDDDDRVLSSTISKSSSSSTSRSTGKLIFNVTKSAIFNSSILVTSSGQRFNETTVKTTTKTMSYTARTSSSPFTSDNAIPYFDLNSTRRDVASPTNDTSTNVKLATTTAK